MRILLSVFISLICINISAQEEFPADVMSFVEAYEARDIQALQALINQGFDVNSGLMIQALGGHPLHKVIEEGNEPLVRMFLDAGASADQPNATTWTPLMIAAYYGHINIVELLLERRADPKATNYWNKTASFWSEYQVLEYKDEPEVQQVYQQITNKLSESL